MVPKLRVTTTFCCAPLSGRCAIEITRINLVAANFNDIEMPDEGRLKRSMCHADGDDGRFEDASLRSGLDKKRRLVLPLSTIFARGVFANVV